MGIEKIVGAVAKPVEQAITRGLRSKYLIASRDVGDQFIMLFHNPKSGNTVIKNVEKIGVINTYGYKGTRRVLSFNNKEYGLLDAIGNKNLQKHPETLAFSYTPDKAIVESINPWFRFKSIASKGKVTNYDEFCGTLVKGTIENQSVAEFVSQNPFMH